MTSVAGVATPGLAVSMVATFDRRSNGGVLINVVTGGDQEQFEADGVFTEHVQRSEISDEFLRVWRGALSGEGAT